MFRCSPTKPRGPGGLGSGWAWCHSAGTEIVFGVTQEGDGGFVAECLSHDIFTEGDIWEQLRNDA